MAIDGEARQVRRGARTAALPTPPPTRLIGRDPDLVAVGALLDDEGGRLVTITGPAGVGKTRLALAAAHRLRETRAIDVRWVDLLPAARPAAVPAAIAAALGSPGTPGGAALAHQLAARARRRSLLLVLDNVEHVLGAAAILPALLGAAPGLRLLVTSREPLHLFGERRYPLAPLTLPDPGAPTVPEALATVPAVALFLDRARAVLPGFVLDDGNVGAVVALCARLDGLPLAIELAAAGLPLFAPEAMLAYLDVVLPRLPHPAADAPRRHRTLADALGWGYRRLAAGERRLLRRLAVFAGSWTLDAAAALGASTDEATLPALAALVEQGLAIRTEHGTEPRFRLLGVVRAFALERLAADGEADAAARDHAAYCAALAERAAPELLGPAQLAWFERLERDGDDLRAALRWAAAHDTALEQRLAGALWRAWRRARSLDGRRWLEHALLAGEAAAPPRLAALEGAGALAEDDGDRASARAHYTERLHLAEQLGDDRETGRALVDLGWLALRDGTYRQAAPHLEAGLAHCLAVGDPWGAGRALHGLGALARGLGAREEAGERLAEALALLAEAGDRFSVAAACWDAAHLAAERGDLRVAQRHVGAGLRVGIELGDAGALAIGTATAAALLAEQPDPADVVRLLGAVDGMGGDHAQDGPSEHHRLQRALLRAEATLGEAQCDRLWAEGRAWAAAEAATEALALVEAAFAHPPEPKRAAGEGPLSARERAVVQLVAGGLGNQQIAAVQHVALRTVKQRVTTAMTKLHVHNRAELAAVATARHLV